MSALTSQIRHVNKKLERSLNGIISSLSTQRRSQLGGVLVVSFFIGALSLKLIPLP